MAGTWEATLGPPCPPLRPDRGRPEARPWGSLPCRRVPLTPAAFPSRFLAEGAGSTCACWGWPCTSPHRGLRRRAGRRPWARAFLNVLAQCPRPVARSWGQGQQAEPLSKGLGGRAGVSPVWPGCRRVGGAQHAQHTRKLTSGKGTASPSDKVTGDTELERKNNKLPSKHPRVRAKICLPVQSSSSGSTLVLCREPVPPRPCSSEQFQPLPPCPGAGASVSRCPAWVMLGAGWVGGPWCVPAGDRPG